MLAFLFSQPPRPARRFHPYFPQMRRKDARHEEAKANQRENQEFFVNPAPLQRIRSQMSENGTPMVPNPASLDMYVNIAKERKLDMGIFPLFSAAATRFACSTSGSVILSLWTFGAILSVTIVPDSSTISCYTCSPIHFSNKLERCPLLRPRTSNTRKTEENRILPILAFLLTLPCCVLLTVLPLHRYLQQTLCSFANSALPVPFFLPSERGKCFSFFFLGASDSNTPIPLKYYGGSDTKAA